MRAHTVLRAAVAAGLLLGASCASGPRFRCPARGGPAWRATVSEHFVLRTDLPRGEAAALVARLERMRAAVAAALFPDAPAAPGRIEVIAFRSPEEYQPFAPESATGYYLRYAGGPPRIVLSGALSPSQRALLAHELTHHFLASVFQRQPRWFAEGLAVYMESLGEDAPASRGGSGASSPPGRDAVWLGQPPPTRLAWARSEPIPTRELLAWDGSPGRHPGLAWYASSWRLVHWLVNRRGRAFAELQRRLAAGEEPAAAWRAALPDLDPASPRALEALDRTLHAYALGELERHRRAVDVPVAVASLEQPMTPPEVHAVRLALWGYGPDRGREALVAEVREALAEDPAHPVALQVQAELEGGDAAALARRATEGHPDDPRAWSFLALALRGSPDAAARENALRRAIALAPENAAALHALAQELLARGRSGEALPLARRAVQLAPWSPPVLAGFAKVLSDLGQCEEALAVQRRALDALPERAGAETRAELTAGLGAYAAQCRVAERPEAR
jgi:tetratricopeptide (TPR) repeat protein